MTQDISALDYIDDFKKSSVNATRLLEVDLQRFIDTISTIVKTYSEEINNLNKEIKTLKSKLNEKNNNEPKKIPSEIPKTKK